MIEIPIIIRNCIFDDIPNKVRRQQYGYEIDYNSPI